MEFVLTFLFIYSSLWKKISGGGILFYIPDQKSMCQVVPGFSHPPGGGGWRRCGAMRGTKKRFIRFFLWIGVGGKGPETSLDEFQVCFGTSKF